MQSFSLSNVSEDRVDIKDMQGLGTREHYLAFLLSMLIMMLWQVGVFSAVYLMIICTLQNVVQWDAVQLKKLN